MQQNADQPEIMIEPSLKGARVIIALGDLELGGAEHQALLLAQHLIEEQHASVEVWGLGAREGRAARLCEERGIPWRLVTVRWYSRRRNKVRDLARLTLALRRARPDAILSYLIMPNVACGLVWRLTGARLCIWNQRCTGIDRLGRRVEREAVKRVPWFATNSRGGAEFLTETLGARSDRVRVIHNAIRLAPAERDRAAWRSSLGIDDDTFVACMVANLTLYKDHQTLLRAWRRVLNGLESQGRTGVLLLAGRTTDSHNTLDALKILAFDQELGRSVRFLGQVNDVSGLLGASDLGVLSSPSESSPNGVLESMAAGLAVVGTNNSGLREALGSGGDDFLGPGGDADALADRILRLASDKSLRATVGAANRLRIEKEFNPRVTCQQMASLIAEGLRESKAGRRAQTAAQALPAVETGPPSKSSPGRSEAEV